MRNFKRDPKPSEGWSVDWNVEDHLKYGRRRATCISAIRT